MSDAFPTFENAVAELGEVDQGRALAKSQIQHWRNEYAQLNRRRKQLVRAIDRMSKRMLRITEGLGVSQKEHVFAADVVHQVENTLNARGVMEGIIQARFDMQAARTTGARPWRGLKPGTIKGRIRAGYGAGPILQNESVLLANAMTAVADTFKMNFEEIEWPDIDSIGLEYAAAQNFGYPGNNLPARPFFLRPSKEEMAPIYAEARALLLEFSMKKRAGVGSEEVRADI